MDLVCGGAARNDRHRLGYSQFSAVRLASFGGVPGPIQDGRIYIEKINGPFLFGDMGTPAEYSGLERDGSSLSRLRIPKSGVF